MDFELIEVGYCGVGNSNCFPDFFDDCNPTDNGCIPSEMDDEGV